MPKMLLWCDRLEETGGREAFERGNAVFREPGPFTPEDQIIEVEYKDQLDLTEQLRHLLKNGAFGDGFGSRRTEAEDGSGPEGSEAGVH